MSRSSHRDAVPARAASPARPTAAPSGRTEAEASPLPLGNQALQQLLRSGAVQAKLTVSQPGDPAEQEADRVAGEVMRTPEAGAGGSPVPPGGGQPLPQPVRSFFEPRFGRDLGHVRLHTDARAAESARTLQARAYAFGPNIVMARGEYAPATDRGKWLLAHEIAHVVQTRSAPSSPGVEAVEQDAEQAATAAVTGGRVHLRQHHDGRRLHRFGEPQHVPQFTYIAGQDPANDGFLQQATDYHRTWGLRPRLIHSLQGVINHLSSGTGTVSRIRIVTHASQQNLFTALFPGGVPGITKDLLRAFAESDQRGLASLSGELVRPHLVTRVLNEVRGGAYSHVLQPFGLDAAGSTPTGAVATLISRSVALLMFQQGSGGDPAQAPVVTAALDAELAELRRQVQGPAPGGVTAGQALALQNAILGVTTITFTTPTLGTDAVTNLQAATTAVTGNFRTRLNRARARLTSSSWIDIRGCQAGVDPDYLHAVSEFFGTATQRPHVSAPQWFQSFPTLTSRGLLDRDIPTWAGDTDVRAALDHWSSVTGLLSRFLWWRSFLLQILIQDLARQAGPGTLFLTPPPPLLGGLVAPAVPELPLPGAGGLQLQPPLGTPSRGPSLGLGGTSSLVTWAEAELTRLSQPDSLLRYYLDAALVLPVQSAISPQDISLFLKESLADRAMDNWLGSLWSPAAPGLAALRRGDWRAGRARQVEAVVGQDATGQTTQMFISPDPRYEEHIREI